MKRTIATACVLAMMSGAICAWQSTPQAPAVAKAPTAQNKAAAKPKTSLRKKAKTVAPPPLPAQEMPPLPATLMNSTPVKPNVTLEGGQLTIDAPNSTLSDVLSGVRKATGASIEGAVPTERVAVKLGPGNPEQVLAALLRGTPYDYVILGALGKPDVVTRVMLTQQSSTAAAAGPSAAAQAPSGGGSRSEPQPPPGDDSVSEHTPADDAAAAPESAPDQAQQTPQPQPDANQPKTPEQLFKELQELNQQKQPK